MDKFECVIEALKIAAQYGQIDGAHHKTWVIDQMVRELLKACDQVSYEAWVETVKDGEHGPDTYEWDEGIAP